MEKLKWTKCADGLGVETQLGNYSITRITCRNYKTLGTTNIYKYFVYRIQPYYAGADSFRSLKQAKAYIARLEATPCHKQFSVLVECVSNGSRGVFPIHATDSFQAMAVAEKLFRPTYRPLEVLNQKS